MTDSNAYERVDQPTGGFTQSAREFAINAADRVRENASSVHEKAQQATTTMESFATGTVVELARISRDAQTALFDDVKAALDAFANIARAKSLADAAQLQFDYLGNRSRVNVERMQSAVDFVKTKFNDSYAKWTERGKAA